MGSLKKPLRNFMINCHIQELMDNNFEFQSDDKSVHTSIEHQLPPEIPKRTQIDQITEKLLINICRERDFSKIIYLNLFHNKIRKVESLDSLVNLQILILAFNELEQIEGLSNCKKIQQLDLTHNFIRTIAGLEELTELTVLELGSNWLTEINQLDYLATSCSNLLEVGFKNNPIAIKESYRAKVFQKLPKVKKLDGMSFSEKEKQQGNSNGRELSYDLVIEHLNAKQKASVDQSKEGENADSSSVFATQVQEINMSHMQIQKIQQLDNFFNLRKLILLDNHIKIIEGLESLRVLEELNLEKNKLTVIENLEFLKYLKKLDLGSNKIKKISNIESLQNLTQLSLENNEISRLEGLEELQCLMELYLGNNLISDIKETMKLKDLQRLIILDISGNPLCSQMQNNYRIYCIYHLKKLRVLDGISIDNQEHLEAKDTFSGRLTEEILTSRLKGRSLFEIRELDLTGCKLRDFEDMFDKSICPYIKELNLSNNYMTSLRGFGDLPSLQILRLRDNKIETLFCKPNPDGSNNVKGLLGMPNLVHLDVSNNSLQYLYGLQYSPLRELQVLHVAGNEIVKIEHIERLKKLRELDLSRNKIKQIDPQCFYPSNQIILLKLDENGLKTFANIEQLQRLQTLYASNNRIQEFYEVEKIAELTHLLDLSLTSNPLARKPNYRIVVVKRLTQLLVLDGKEISPEERKRLEGTTTMIDTKPPGSQLIHFQQYPTVKVPVKLNSVNFDGVFNNMKFQIDQQQSNSAGLPQLGGIRGIQGSAIGDMSGLMQVSGVQVNNQIANGVGFPMNYTPSGMGAKTFGDDKGIKGIGNRPSTNKFAKDQQQQLQQMAIQNRQMLAIGGNNGLRPSNESGMSISAAVINQGNVSHFATNGQPYVATQFTQGGVPNRLANINSNLRAPQYTVPGMHRK